MLYPLSYRGVPDRWEQAPSGGSLSIVGGGVAIGADADPRARGSLTNDSIPQKWVGVDSCHEAGRRTTTGSMCRGQPSP